MRSLIGLFRGLEKDQRNKKINIGFFLIRHLLKFYTILEELTIRWRFFDQKQNTKV